MALRFLLDALDETHHVSVATEFCKRVRFRKSTCQICLDVCPDNAITLSPGPSINDNCTNCGLCQNACPTEVFQNGVSMDQLLLKQVESLLSKDRTASNKKELFIHCSQAEKQDKESLAVPCLGNISENFFLGAALSGLDEVNLTKGHCSHCHLKNGEALLTNAMTTFQAMVENIVTEEFALSLRQEPRDNDVDAPSTRREFFSKIVHRATGDATATLSEQADGEITNVQLEIGDGTRLSPKREMLRKLIEQNGRDNANVDAKEQASPWKKMKVDEGNCVACGICVNVCPTGALTKTFESNQIVRHLNYSVCTNCYLCQEACPESVISFKGNYDVTDLVEDKKHVVARIDMSSCVICGEIIIAGRGELCTTCDKRQISPMFMTV